MALIWGCAPAREPLPPADPPPAPGPELPKTPPPDDDRDVGNACREQVAGLEDWLRMVEGSGLPLAMSLLDDGAKLVTHQGAQLVEPAPLVHVTTGPVRLDGAPVELPNGLVGAMTKLIELRKSMMPRSPFIASPRAYLAIDADVKWERVTRVVDELASAGIDGVTFVFADKSRQAPRPPPSPIDDELAGLTASGEQKREQTIAELIAYVYQDCPEALKVIAQMGAHEVADFKQVILDELPAAIGACRCAPDDAAVKALHWAIFGNPQPASGVSLELAAPKGQPEAVLSLPADQAWSEAHRPVIALAQENKRVRLSAAADDKPPR